jgi:hypothetical protein
LGLFCKLSHYRNLIARVGVDPDALSAAQLHEKAWQAGAAAFLDPAAEAKSTYASEAVNRPERVEAESDRVLAAAQSGRVATLLVAKPVAAVAGNEFRERLPQEAEPAAYIPSDVIEQAVQATYRNGGQVVLVPANELPDGVEAAAVMRY